MCIQSQMVIVVATGYDRFLRQLNAGEISPVGQTDRRIEEQNAYGHALRRQTECYQSAGCHECRKSVSMAIRADFAARNAHNMAHWRRLVDGGLLPADILDVKEEL